MLASLLGITLLSVLWRLWLRAGLDLRGWPGAAGGQRITEAARGNFSQTFDGWSVGVMVGLLGGDPGRAVDAVYLGSMLGGAAMVLGAGLAGWALAGGRTGLVAAALVGAWAPAAWVSLLTGADAVSIGLSWLGLGVCWWGARGGVAGLPGVVLGAVLVALGLAIKDNVLPVLAFVALSPLLAPGMLQGALTTVTLGATLLWARGRLLGDLGSRADVQGGSVSGEAWAEGLDVVARLPDNGLGYGAFHELALLSLFGLLLPVRRPLARLAVVASPLLLGPLMAGLRFASARPRVLLPLGLGLVLGSAVMLGRSADLLAASRRLRELRWLPAGAFVLLLGLDGLGFLGAWSEGREDFVGTEASELPGVPGFVAARHARLSLDLHRTTTHLGAIFVDQLPERAPRAGVGLAPLRDRREADQSAALELAGVPWRVLDVQRCCPGGGASAECAEGVVQALDEAGALLVLPTPEDRDERVDMGQLEWVRALTLAAVGRGGLRTVDERWLLREGQGSGGELPCDQAPQRGPGPRMPPGPVPPPEG